MCQTYKDMIQDLRDKAEFLNKTDYDRNATNSFADAMRQAANAIERLCIENDCLSEDVTDLVRELYKSKWIPVTERLPIRGDRVICFGDNGINTVDFVCGDKWCALPWFYLDGEQETGVTHWMPLPEPPKEETE